MNTPPVIEQFLKFPLGMAEDVLGKNSVSIALKAAMRREGVSDPEEYERLFISSGDVRQQFIDDIVVSETWFFRDHGPFTCLAGHARKLCMNGPLKILSAPCSTGEEPYSIVMTLLAEGLPSSAFSVDGVDVSLRAIKQARDACYGNGAFRGHIGINAARFFQETPQGRKLSDQVVRHVNLYHDNLISPLRLEEIGPYSIIFCRNLLIYLNNGARKRIFELLNSLLLPEGILFTGHTETVFWQQHGYIPLQWDRAFALSKPSSRLLIKPTSTAMPQKSPLYPSARSNGIQTLKAPCKTSDRKAPAPGKMHNAPENQRPVKPKSSDAASSTSGRIQEARRLADLGKMDSALALCRECMISTGPSAESYCLMGVIHMARQDIKGAEELFLKAIYLDPGHYESLVHISLIYRQKGEERKELLYRDRAERNADATGNAMKSLETKNIIPGANG